MVDEANAPGGQVYRAFPPEFEAKGRLARKKEYRESKAMVRAVSAFPEITRWQDGLFWGVDSDGTLLIARDQRIARVKYDQLIVASGAYDRSLPFPGWTLPGVLSVGGAYRLVKVQGVLPGKRVLVVGTGPLLLVLTEVLIESGANVVAVVDSAASSARPKHLLDLIRVPSLCLEALRLKGILRRSKTPVLAGWGIAEAKGEEDVSEALCAPFTDEGRLDRSREKAYEADAVVVGYGLLSRTAVYRLLHARMAYDGLVGDYIPTRSEDLETSVTGVFGVGDGARVAGKLVAREEGTLAALAVTRRLGKLSDAAFHTHAKRVRRKLNRLYRFRKAVDEIFRLPGGLYDIPDDDTVICRCEEITAGEIRGAAQEGTLNLNDIKRRVRSGSGWCQGRTCGPAIVEMLARDHRIPRETIFRMTQRPPTKPIPMSMLIEGDAAV
jgi:hydrogen cyanide synthase HcnB